MYINFVPDLFLEVAELVRFKESLDSNGFRKALLEGSISFGLVKTDKSPSFINGRVERDLDNALNQKTIKINPLLAVNNQGEFIVAPLTNNFPVPSDGNWYWVKINHQYSTQEAGKVTIDASGNLTGVGTEFRKILRGNPNFASVIKFVNTAGNTLEYPVLEVIDDTHAIIVHPAVTGGGNADFIAEANLNYEIVGTFTDGVAVPNENKMPFRYDSCNLTLVQEIAPNTRPTFVQGQEFFLARVRVTNGNLVIQDKRTDYWESKGSDKAIRIDRSHNPLIGVETARWQNVFNTGDRNIVEVAWGMRSTNWTIDSSQNIVTFLGGSLGGSFKTVADFTDGNFNGMRIYYPNGQHSTVVNSIKQGSAINLYVDVLDVDNVSTDGGVTFIPGQLLVTPDCEEVEIRFTANPIDSIHNVDDIFRFPVNTAIGECLPTVYIDDLCLYNVQYRYKSFKEFTQWRPINSGSYLTEKSFKEDGSLKPSSDQISFAYTSDALAGFVQLELSPNSWKRFKELVYKGDIIGVNTITAFSPAQVVALKVGVDKRYQHVVGTISVSGDIYISLERIGAVEGNEFRLHFECDALNLGSNKIYICDDYSSGVLTIVKQIVQSDAYEMQNQEGGIVIDCVFDETGKWIAYQNYNLGQPFEIKMFDNDVTAFFDVATGSGKVPGYFGWKVHQILSGKVPIGFGTGVDENGVSKTFAIGTDAGEYVHTLTEAQMPSHSHFMWKDGGGQGPLNTQTDTSAMDAALGGNPSYRIQGYLNANGSQPPTKGSTSKTGGGAAHNVTQPYHVVAFIKKQY